ncbi:uncharacterized protein FOMMEDRAFT_43901, partial [Fomitiporia mediterranea MF3/22]|uniref:uncharacterized protein n=1 Tax=Fomitiporia mediterranea (strain MF3/22) TaxID=694068 RepID=UPI00044073B3
ETLQTVRHDSFERELTIRWLTGFISRSSSWMLPNDQELLDDELEEREVLIEKAASLLSSCANINEVDDEALSRKFKFPLGPADAGTNICVELNDLQATEDHSSVGLQSWPSSICFARMTSENPAGFNIVSGRTRRVLELGAGTGMLSIVTAKICRALSGGKPFGFPQIVATDYHPDVLLNLKRNVESNFASDTHLPVDVYPFDWQHPSWEHPFDAPYDLILAADVIYEPEHAGWIKDCVSRLLKRPSPSYPEGGVFWMFIALRNIGRREGLAAKVFDVFPTLDTELVKSSDELSLKAVQVRDLERSEGIGRKDESGYRLFKIRWA